MRWNATNTKRVYTATDLGITAAANWTLASCYATSNGPDRTLVASFTYGGATITGASNGGMPDTALLATLLPAAWTARAAAPFAFMTDSFGVGYISTTGQIYLASLAATATITSGTQVWFAAHYIV